MGASNRKIGERKVHWYKIMDITGYYYILMLQLGVKFHPLVNINWHHREIYQLDPGALSKTNIMSSTDSQIYLMLPMDVLCYWTIPGKTYTNSNWSPGRSDEENRTPFWCWCWLYSNHFLLWTSDDTVESCQMSYSNIFYSILWQICQSPVTHTHNT